MEFKEAHCKGLLSAHVREKKYFIVYLKHKTLSVLKMFAEKYISTVPFYDFNKE